MARAMSVAEAPASALPPSPAWPAASDERAVAVPDLRLPPQHTYTPPMTCDGAIPSLSLSPNVAVPVPPSSTRHTSLGNASASRGGSAGPVSRIVYVRPASARVEPTEQSDIKKADSEVELERKENGTESYEKQQEERISPRRDYIVQMHGKAFSGARPSSPVSRITSTFRRMPSSYHSVSSLAQLPSDLLLHICTLLRSPELCVLSGTNKYLRELSSRPQVWRLRCGFLASPEVRLLSVRSMLNAEKSLRGKWLKYRTWKINKINENYHAAIKRHYQTKTMCCIHFWSGAREGMTGAPGAL
jgi:hypothetical protein